MSNVGVIGLDLSLSRTGMCCIPPDWNGLSSTLRFFAVRTKKEPSFGDPRKVARNEVDRYIEIADGVVRFVRDCGVQDVGVEGYAFGAFRDKGGANTHSTSVTKLAELGGVVKSQLVLSCGIVAVPVVASSARAHLTGGLKRGDKVKVQVARYLRRFGFDFDSFDEMDAFVVANYMYDTTNRRACRFLAQCSLL